MINEFQENTEKQLNEFSKSVQGMNKKYNKETEILEKKMEILEMKDTINQIKSSVDSLIEQTMLKTEVYGWKTQWPALNIQTALSKRQLLQ